MKLQIMSLPRYQTSPPRKRRISHFATNLEQPQHRSADSTHYQPRHCKRVFPARQLIPKPLKFLNPHMKRVQLFEDSLHAVIRVPKHIPIFKGELQVQGAIVHFVTILEQDGAEVRTLPAEPALPGSSARSR